MAASVVGYWPGISDEQLEAQPGFLNDCNAWGSWMAEREEHQDVLAAMRRLGVGALCTLKTDGVPDPEVAWVTPGELKSAALRLRELVLASHPETKRILDTYAKSAIGEEPVSEEFARDLSDVAEIADFAEQEGAARMTLEVNW